MALQNAREIYSILFRAASETLLTIAADPKRMGAAVGFLTVLHTWGENLHLHPHLHCVVPGGGLGPDGKRSVACRKSSFFLPVKVLSSRFRNVFLSYLRKAFEDGKLQFHGEMAALNRPGIFEALCRRAEKAKWVVFVKPPFGGPEQVLKYLARYTHRVAISNSRILSIEDGEVKFQWKTMPRVTIPSHDARRGRVNPALSSPHFASWIRSHPTVWVSGKPRAKGKTRPVPNPAECTAGCGARRSRGAGPNTEREVVPGLPDRPDDSHLGLSDRTTGLVMTLRLRTRPQTTFVEADGDLRPAPPFRYRRTIRHPVRPELTADTWHRLPSVHSSKSLLHTGNGSQKNIKFP